MIERQPRYKKLTKGRVSFLNGNQADTTAPGNAYISIYTTGICRDEIVANATFILHEKVLNPSVWQLSSVEIFIIGGNNNAD